MRPVPIPDGVAEQMGGRRTVIGEGDPTRDDVRPCEYVVRDSKLFPGRPTVSALVVLDDGEREMLAGGASIWLTLDGGELPWALTVAATEEQVWRHIADIMFEHTAEPDRDCLACQAGITLGVWAHYGVDDPFADDDS